MARNWIKATKKMTVRDVHGLFSFYAKNTASIVENPESVIFKEAHYMALAWAILAGAAVYIIVKLIENRKK